jgi:ABC-type multidrug transport system fused ATPase/permease subunit
MADLHSGIILRSAKFARESRQRGAPREACTNLDRHFANKMKKKRGKKKKKKKEAEKETKKKFRNRKSKKKKKKKKKKKLTKKKKKKNYQKKNHNFFFFFFFFFRPWPIFFFFCALFIFFSFFLAPLLLWIDSKPFTATATATMAVSVLLRELGFFLQCLTVAGHCMCCMCHCHRRFTLFCQEGARFFLFSSLIPPLLWMPRHLFYDSVFP